MKLYRFIWILLFGVSLLQSQEWVYIPDPAFRQYLKENFPNWMKDDSLNATAAATFSGTIDCGGRGIQDLTGIQYFKNITELRCSYNQLSTLPPLDSLKELRFLSVDNNQLTSLPDLTNNTRLVGLWFNNNQIQTLPAFGTNPPLQFLIGADNLLSGVLDFTAFRQLTIVYLQNNRIQTLRFGSAPVLKELWVDNNLLHTIDGLENLTALEEFRAGNNQLEAGDIDPLAMLPNLVLVDVSSNELRALPDFSGAQTLESFNCKENYLDFSDAEQLLTLDALPGMQFFEYVPQRPFWPLVEDTLFISENSSVTLQVAPQGQEVSYQWFKNGNPIPGATGATFTIPFASTADSGAVFFCQTTSNLLANMHFGPGITTFHSRDIYLIVYEGNDFPSFVTQQLPDAVEDVPYHFVLEVSDPDSNSEFRFQILQGPEWLQINANGELQGTPTIADTGSSTVQIVVTDNGTPPLNDTLTTTIRVVPNPNAPIISLIILQNPALPQYANIVVASNVLLKTAPKLILEMPDDTLTLAVSLLARTDRLYQAKVVFQESGIHRLLASAERLNGRDTTVVLEINALQVLEGQASPQVLTTPSGKARLQLPREVWQPGQVFLAWEEGEVAHFSPPVTSEESYLLQMQYQPVADAGQLFIYQQEGENWVQLPSVVNPQRRTIRALVKSPGSFRVFRDEYFTGSNLQPEKFALLNNYPNPFNPATTIPYHLAEDGIITLTVYNVLGQKIRTLVNGFQLAGRYRVVWDGRNDLGEVVPGGVYFYQLRTQQVVLNQRMIYLR